MSNRYEITALKRGLDVLALFNANQTQLSLKEIQQKTGLNKSTAFRVVTTLEQEGYLQRDPLSKAFSPGLKVLQLGFSSIHNLELRKIARPFLEQLAQECRETVSLCVLQDMNTIYVDRVRYQNFEDHNLGIGSVLPAHCTSMGQVMLAYMPEKELERKLSQNSLADCYPNAGNIDTLKKDLETIRNQGYAVWLKELDIGLLAVAAPIWDSHAEVVAALNIVGSIRTISQERLETDLARAVLSCSKAVSKALGFKS